MTSSNPARVALLAGLLIALTLLGFFYFPGHTYLQSDTQIYIPIFERLENPNLYARDFMLTTAHVGLTIYDETAIWLRRLTGGTFEFILEAEQIVFRALGLWGVFLIATSIGLGDAAALLLAACYGLGATIVGPAVLSVEYEPVPRGFAVAFVLLGAGLLMHGRYTWACAAASVGFLYHSPATIPFWILFVLAVIQERRWRTLWPLGAAVTLLAVTFAAQQSHIRPQPLLAVVDPQWEHVIRMRTAYDWIGQWPSGSVISFVLYSVAALAALWRTRTLTTMPQRLILAGFPVIGVLSIAGSWVLLDEWKWALVAQVQPARAALFTIVFAQINCGVAGLIAVRGRRWAEGLLWFIPVFLPPVVPLVMNGVTPAQVATVALLAAAAVVSSAAMALRAPSEPRPSGSGPPLFSTALRATDSDNEPPVGRTSGPRPASRPAHSSRELGTAPRARAIRWLAAPLVAAAGCWAIPHFAHTVNYPDLHSPELDQLSDWARTQTSDQALFVFPTSGHNLEQGVFRVKGLRSLYTDWKAGGQVNYFRDFALEWLKRWQELSSGRLSVEDWRARGVNYLIYSGPRTEQLGQPVYENTRYRAYQVPPAAAVASSAASRNAQ